MAAEEPEKTHDEHFAEFIGSLVDLAEHLDPIQTFAVGQREKLLRDGWSSVWAEKIAGDALIEMQRAMFCGNMRGDN